MLLEMTASENIYQSILLKLSNIPVVYLQQVDNYFQHFTITVKDKEWKHRNRAKIMAMAGSWNDMSESEFQDYLTAAKNTGKELFNPKHN